MTDSFDLSELKAQARRLRAALEPLGASVSHSQALDLVGRVHGHRDWRELVGVQGARSARPSAPDAAQQELVFLSMHLLCCGFTAEEVARATDLGTELEMADVLRALFRRTGSFEALLALLRTRLAVFSFEACGVYARAWGPSVPAGVEFDALPWLMQAEPATLLALIQTSRTRFSLGNCDTGDHIAVWSAEQGRTGAREDRERLAQLLQAIRAHQAFEPQALGVTVELSASDMACFLELAMEADPARYDVVMKAFDALP